MTPRRYDTCEEHPVAHIAVKLSAVLSSMQRDSAPLVTVGCNPSFVISAGLRFTHVNYILQTFRVNENSYLV